MDDAADTHHPHLGFDWVLTGELRRGIQAELRAATDDEVVELTDGRTVGEVGGRTYWSFAAPIEPTSALTAETPAQLRTVEGDLLHVTVVAVGDESVTIALREDAPGRLESASLRLDVAFVLNKLHDRMDELDARGPEMVLIDQLVDPDQLDDPAEGGTSEKDLILSPVADQERAANLAVEPGIRFTWGPPGTGKTKVLGQAVGIAARRDDQVLVVAHANAAVDVAAARIAAELSGDPLIASGSVLRVGTPLPTSKGLHDVLPEVVADGASPDRARRRSDLRVERANLSDRLRSCQPSDGAELTARLLQVRTELAELERLHQQSVRELIDRAAVIVTTLTRAVIDDAIWGRDWDVVLVDEASMAPLPMVLALAMRGPRTLSAIGDPRQLPPVHRADDPVGMKWFGKDMFSFAGFDDPCHDPWRDPRLSTLRVQFRMGETICAAVGEFAYDGMLLTDSSARNRGIRLAESRPGASVELVIVDVSSIGARCWADPAPGSFSRLNPTSGLLAATVVAELLATGCESGTLVSPYRAQVRWLTLLADEIEGATASTVHRLQGSESDAIVLDLTDAQPMTKPSRLTGEDRDLATRLLTVAASRARGKLVLLADLSFIDERVALGGPVRRFAAALDAAGAEHCSALELITASIERPLRCVQWHGSWSEASDSIPMQSRASGPGGQQPWLVTDGHLLLGTAAGDGPAAVVQGSRLVDGFLNGVVGVGGH